MRIGKQAHAHLIARHYSNGGSRSAPEGWKYLGSGWSRYAYLGPDEVVYKVGYNYVNRWERRNVSTLSKISHPTIKVPRCTSWTVKDVCYINRKTNKSEPYIVNAMEYIKGTKGSPSQDVSKFFGVTDGFCGNYVFTETGICYLIDLGETPIKVVDGKVV